MDDITRVSLICTMNSYYILFGFTSDYVCVLSSYCYLMPTTSLIPDLCIFYAPSDHKIWIYSNIFHFTQKSRCDLVSVQDIHISFNFVPYSDLKFWYHYIWTHLITFVFSICILHDSTAFLNKSIWFPTTWEVNWHNLTL